MGTREFKIHLTPAERAKLEEKLAAPPGQVSQAELRRLVTRGNRRARLLTPVRECRRNDVCPCGSGKKFKKCCGLRPARKDVVHAH